MTALERLKQLSGLSGASTGEALRKIAGASGLAGALLAGYSGLPTGTAAEHLLANGQQVSQPVGGGGAWLAHHVQPQKVTQRQRTSPSVRALLTIHSSWP